MSSGFITENEIAESRKKRQEEWEKVRKAEDPLERPEEPYETKSLYERLQEQKQKRDLEYEETHKLKNMIKGLDDDEIDFLNEVDRTKLAADRKKLLEEERELNDYRNRVVSLQEQKIEEKLHAEINVSKPKNISNTNRTKQGQLLKGVVVKKNEGQKRKLSDTQNECNTDGGKTITSKNAKVSNEKSTVKSIDSESEINKCTNDVGNNGLKCIGILPGLGCYNESSSDECSSDFEADEINSGKDWLGRVICKKEKPVKTTKNNVSEDAE